MVMYMETESFVRACNKATTKITKLPDAITRSNYTTGDVLANARAMLAAAESVRAAAQSVVDQLTPAPPINNYYSGRPPSNPPGSVA